MVSLQRVMLREKPKKTLDRGPPLNISMTPAPSLFLPVTALYAGLCGAFYAFMTVAIINTRRANKIPYGDGGYRPLQKLTAVSAPPTPAIRRFLYCKR